MNALTIVRRTAPALLVLALALVRDAAVAQQTRPAPVFWLGAVDPVVQRDKNLFAPADYLQLFTAPDRWPTVAAKTAAFEISTQLVLRGTPEEQRTVLDGLRARHIKLAGQFGVLEQPADPACGPHFEGQGSPKAAEAVAQKLTAIGGTLDYLDMDEPVTFGHNSPRNKCPRSIAELADTTAAKVAIYRRYFPQVHLNLIDGVGGNFPPGVDNEIAYVDALGKHGLHLDTFIADVQWSSPWQRPFEQLATRLHARGIKVGLYCDGRITSNSDLAWERDAVADCTAAGNDPQIRPDLYMIGSWSPYPTRALPETTPGTLTHIGKALMAAFP